MDPDLQEPENLNAVDDTVIRYNQLAAEYAVLWGDLHLRRQLRAFSRRVGGQRLVLDLGCGSGRDIRFPTELGCQVVGMDLSTGMLSRARVHLLDAPLIRAGLRHIPPGARHAGWRLGLCLTASLAACAVARRFG